jgi:hypothetical protein
MPKRITVTLPEFVMPTDTPIFEDDGTAERVFLLMTSWGLKFAATEARRKAGIQERPQDTNEPQAEQDERRDREANDFYQLLDNKNRELLGRSWAQVIRDSVFPAPLVLHNLRA